MQHETVRKPIVLVTGAAGKIGRHVTAVLLKQGFQVRGLTTKPVPADLSPDCIDWRSIDFTQSLDFEPHVADCVGVVHLAAEIVNRSRMQRVNVEASKALATAAVRAGVDVFCYISSASVYGSSRSRLVTESSPTVNPVDEVKGEHWAPPAVRHYARTKLLGEKQVIEAALNMKVIILRPTVVVDVAEIFKLATRSPTRQLLVGRRHAHHVYVADVAEAVVWLLRRRLADTSTNEAVTVYNIAEDDAACISYRDLTKRVSGEAKSRPVFSLPSIFDWMIEFVRFGALPWRYSLGRMVFSSDRLRGDGFRLPYGVEHLYERVERQHRATPR